ncbi:SDR family oxidoreductase [Plantactinospora solaniradicis]|uniref:SDR family oxidoreductase n=1 Tax=Plantactinospora solaniradicis TaxID=1723736 RepID=A0ABW1KQ03_9ACTN
MRLPPRGHGQPQEIAAAVTFLLSEDASYLMDVHLAVDGGFLI